MMGIPEIPATIQTAVRRTIAEEMGKPASISSDLILSGAKIYSVLEEIDPAHCAVPSLKHVKKLITFAVLGEGGSIRSRARCSGFAVYQIPAKEAA